MSAQHIHTYPAGYMGKRVVEGNARQVRVVDEAEIADRLYVSFKNPTDLRDQTRIYFADIVQDGEHLAGPFDTEAEAVAVLRQHLEAVCA